MNGKKILVTGASSGIGRATSIILSQLGAQVVLTARSPERLEATRRDLTGTGHGIEPRDLNDFEDLPSWMRILAERHGPFHGLVHCAGLYALTPLRAMDSMRAELLWRVNVFAGLWLAKAYRQRGVGNPGGAIVFISSAVGLIGQPGLAVYSATKGAIISMTRSLALELAREKIRVNCIAPGNLDTPMADVPLTDFSEIDNEHPLGFGKPADVAHAAAFLLSDRAHWITGSVLVADGGYTAH